MGKLSEEDKLKIIEMRSEGITIKLIAKHFNVRQGAIQYHLSEEVRDVIKQRAREHSKKNNKNREPRTEYMRLYMMSRRKKDPKFNEKVKENVRNNNRRMKTLKK